MHAQVSKVFRSVQVHFPSLQDYRFKVQRNLRSLLNKTHEKDFEVLPKLPKRERGSNLFLDIGSNRGEAVHSILMRRPDARIIGFEPNVYLVDKARSIYHKDPRVEIHPFGLGHETGSFTLYVPFYNDYMFDGLASLKEDNARNWLRNRLYGYRECKLRIEKKTCYLKKLDDLNLDPYFIKIDVQGFEYEVLLGGRMTIERSSPILLIETPGDKEISLLASYGYKPFIYKDNKLQTGLGGLNVFFIPKPLQAAV